MASSVTSTRISWCVSLRVFGYNIDNYRIAGTGRERRAEWLGNVANTDSGANPISAILARICAIL